ncbi:unnamed protein product [Calypogeia fissa]
MNGQQHFLTQQQFLYQSLEQEGHYISDEDYEAIWHSLWELEDDVIFSKAALNSDSPESLAAATSSAEAGGSDVIHPGVGLLPLWWDSLSSGPAFRSPLVIRHSHAAEFHERVIVSLVLDYFAPGLIKMPSGSLKEYLLVKFRPILWESIGCPLLCFSCQLIWYRRLQWARWRFQLFRISS